MRILIMTDLEGISGVCVWEQTRDIATLYYQEARRLLMGDISAAVDGCLEGGATGVAVEDGHGGGFNFVPELMHPQAGYLTGRARPPFSAREHIYQGFDAAVLLGYHAMAETPDGLLQHTQSSRAGNRYWYNGVECGEIVQSALLLGHFGIPVIMVTGDSATCREAHRFLGEDLVTACVKESYAEQFGLLLSPAAGQALIREKAREAMVRAGQYRPFQMPLPITGRLCFPDKSTADGLSPRRARRVDDYTFEATFERALDILEF